jgi:hypothetical protein
MQQRSPHTKHLLTDSLVLQLRSLVLRLIIICYKSKLNNEAKKQPRWAKAFLKD